MCSTSCEGGLGSQQRKNHLHNSVYIDNIILTTPYTKIIIYNLWIFCTSRLLNISPFRCPKYTVNCVSLLMWYKDVHNTLKKYFILLIKTCSINNIVYCISIYIYVVYLPCGCSNIHLYVFANISISWCTNVHITFDDWKLPTHLRSHQETIL